MAATMAGAWKAYLESLGLGVPWFRDGKPEDRAELRWGVIQEGIGFDGDLSGDYGDPDRDETLRELVQLDLWQTAREVVAPGRTRVLEDYTLPDALRLALPRPSALQPFAPWRIYGVTVGAAQRWPIADNLLRITWTVTVHRSTRRLP